MTGVTPRTLHATLYGVLLLSHFASFALGKHGFDPLLDLPQELIKDVSKGHLQSC
jgi:hypothetical protein